MVFGQKLIEPNSANKDTMGKGISRGAEWHKIQLHSTFHFREKGAQTMTSILVKTPYYSPWFSAKIWKFLLRQKKIPSERASQEGQNGANFSSIAPSSEELWGKQGHSCQQNALLYFRPKTDGSESSKQWYHRKEHLKRSRMVQISAP